MTSLLEPSADEAQSLLSRLMLDTDPAAGSPMGGDLGSQPEGPGYTTLVPKPGFCVKMKTEKNDKVFINVCVSDNVPEPKDLTEAELIQLLESDDPTGFRIPMSIGEPHAEMDKGGAGCTAYDVIIHPTFLKKLDIGKLFLAFFIQVTREGIEGKYDVQLNQEYVVLKNRKSIGQLQEQNVRTKSKPFIMDMGDGAPQTPTPTPQAKPLVQEIPTTEVKKGPEPKFTLVQEPAEGHPEFIVAEIQLPKVKTASTLTLDVGEDRVVLDTRSNVYYLDIYLPYNVIQEEVGSQFHRKNKILTITMPVQPLS
ncbi:PIH1 domain-containing protein 1-like isoform X2 [Haliotis cracherodii]|uniref:PIH1 domain-containing protein 1-like isoform X2 n=1 Tax=Haliotis cracherodii TaxID=6455 RepID=UPI0039EC9929